VDVIRKSIFKIRFLHKTFNKKLQLKNTLKSIKYAFMAKRASLVSISSTFYDQFFADILAPKITKLKCLALQFHFISVIFWR